MMSNQRQESKLKRNLGFWDLMGIAIGQIIGAGIMSSTGVAIGMTGTGVALAFALSPILTLIAIFPAAILSAAVPTTGGQYRYVSRLLGKECGSFYVIIYLLMNSMLAGFALSFASYLVSIITGLNQQIVAIVILTFFYITNLIGTKAAALFNTIISICLIGGLLLFIGFGLSKINLGYIFAPENLFNHGIGNFISTLALLSSATAGAQVIVELGGEAKNAGKNIPKVMILSTVGVGMLYILIALVAAGILPIKQVANQPLSLVAKEVMPPAAYYLFVIGAALGSTASTLNATLSWVTKPLLVACEDGLLPRKLASVSKNGVPYKLLTLFYIVGVLPLVTGFDLATISKFGTANSLLTKIFVCLALTRLASKYPQQLEKSALKFGRTATTVFAALSICILLVLSTSLLLNLSVYTIGFLAVVAAASFVYSKTRLKNLVIPDDLAIDYTSQENEVNS